MDKELKEALKAKKIGEKELSIILSNIDIVDKKDLKRLGLISEDVKEEKKK